MAEGGEILEGFLCPICMADLGTAVHLVSHFEEEHKEDQDVLKSLKDLLGKVKNFKSKILKFDDDISSSDYEPSSSNSSSASRQVISTGYNPNDTEPQEIGVTRSYTQLFRAVRNNRLERYAAETNKLLIRLDKLLVDLPSEPVKRKAHEQAVVPWIDDKDVKLCPTCAKSFHLARRKHHCRLCGAIMCHDCTQFLSLASAKKMTNPAFGHQGTSDTSPATTILALRRSGSSSSLNSVLSLVDTVTGEQHFRLCIHCKQLLDTREQLKESRTQKPIISQFYERLQTYQTEADQLIAMYIKMCQSLNCGESTYSLQDAQTLRVKILKLAESIDSLSNKIAVLGTRDVENPPQGRALQLQRTIRMAATNYLKEQIVILPALPTEAQLKVLQERRRQEVNARIQQEKSLAAQQARRETQHTGREAQHTGREAQHTIRSSTSHQKSATEQVIADMGWSSEVEQMFNSDDPMIQQMNNIRNYIKQARRAHKYDEVATLEQNLQELQQEFWRQRNSEGGEIESDIVTAAGVDIEVKGTPR